VGEVDKAKEIFVMDYDGYNVRRLTHNNSINVSPSWSPDGGKLLFTSYVSGNPDLYLAGLDGGEVMRLSGWPGLNLGGRWSGAADRIALTLTKDGNPEIYTAYRALGDRRLHLLVTRR
jgi:TolB protein